MISEALSYKFRNVGFVCACLVVPIHVAHPTVGSGVWLDRVLAGAISNVAVPMFFVISGFLLGEKVSQTGWWKREVLKRVKSLLVPFYCWMMLSFVLGGLPSLTTDWRTHAFPFSAYVGELEWPSFIWKFLGVDLTGMPWSGPLWYLRNLFILVLCSAGIVALLRRWGGGWIAFAAILYGVWRFYSPLLPDALNGLFWHGFSLQGLLCFSLGLWLHDRNIRVDLKLGFALLCMGALLNSVSSNFPSGFTNVLNALSWACFGVALWSLVPTCKWPSVLTSAAFPIYLMHNLFIGWMQSFPSVVPSTSSFCGFLLFWFVPVVASILTACVIRRSAPRVSRIVFGGR